MDRWPDARAIAAGQKRIDAAQSIKWRDAPIIKTVTGVSVLLPYLPADAKSAPTRHVSVAVRLQGKRIIGGSCGCTDCEYIEGKWSPDNYILPAIELGGRFIPVCKYTLAAIWRFQQGGPIPDANYGPLSLPRDLGEGINHYVARRISAVNRHLFSI